MYENENQLTALRKKYNKLLWLHIGISAFTVAASFFLVSSSLFTPDDLIPWLIAAGIGLALAIVEYAVERALYRKGKRIHYAMTLILFIALLFLVVLWEAGIFAGVFGGMSLSLLPLVCGFMFNRPLIPAIGLLRDHSRVSDGNPCETVGRMKSGTRREETAVGRDSYLLFEDELTGEVRILRMGPTAPDRRYRVLYLPHSGLAVGKIIPDDLAFDPFGNPIPRDPEDTPASDIPAYTEESYADKPDYTEEADYTEAAAPTPEELDPNSPARKRAAKFALASRLCKVLTIASAGFVILWGILRGDGVSAAMVIPGFLVLLVSSLLWPYFKKQDLKLRCTRRASARCVDTVRRKSGKYSHTLHPIVGYEVNGVSYTAELPISCTQSSIGELYTICYDPLDPGSARPA